MALDGDEHDPAEDTDVGEGDVSMTDGVETSLSVGEDGAVQLLLSISKDKLTTGDDDPAGAKPSAPEVRNIPHRYGTGRGLGDLRDRADDSADKLWGLKATLLRVTFH